MIEILMATFNGEKYIHEQINSILSQFYKDFHITIRDDCSTDNTVSILKKYVLKYPDKFTLVNSPEKIGSVCKSFSALLKQCDAEYVAFCDQDDVWKKDKLSVEIRKIKQLENQNGKNTPILVHSDLEVVDENLHLLHKSFLKLKNLSGEPTLEHLLYENSITGSTCLFNRALLQLAKKIPDEVIIHDWWVALVAASFGKIGFVPSPLTLFRTNSSNILGTKSKDSTLNYFKTSLQYSYKQAEILLVEFSENLPITTFKIIGDYACFLIQSKLNKVKMIMLKGYRKNSIKGLISQIVYC